MLLSRYGLGNGGTEDLEEAISIAREALTSVAADSPGRVDALANLSAQLAIRGQSENFAEAEAMIREAIALTPAETPQYGTRLLNLGSLLKLSPDPLQNARAAEAYLQAWGCTSSVPFARITAVVQAIDLLIIEKDYRRARKAAEEAIDLMPLITSQSLDRRDQQHIIALFAGLTSKGCALILQDDANAAAAIERLEQGRGIILGLLIDSHSDISSLRSALPRLAEEYERLRKEVSAPIAEESSQNIRSGIWRRRKDAQQQLERCVQEIRQSPGHARFLLGQTAQEIKSCATSGPIIIVNVTEFRSDAILVQPEKFVTLSLPLLTAEKCRAWANEDRNNKEMREILQDLWVSCVKQVTKKLQSDGFCPARSRLPQVWWIGVGLASSLPFHAAGEHSKGSTENTLNNFISSYTPTVKALAFSRRRNTASVPPALENAELLLVTMETTPDYPSLVSVGTEATEIKEITKDAFMLRNLTNPDAETVMKGLAQAKIAHFACHGEALLQDPVASHLVLQRLDSEGGQQQDPLTVAQIAEANLQAASIAYLSACSTAQNKSRQLADEVLHLVSGFQVAGFGHVIGCLWPADDDACLLVAQTFYQSLVDSTAHGSFADQDVAYALHLALVKARQEYRRSPLEWAAYVHYGA
jgi:CHAT domain-containing protein